MSKQTIAERPLIELDDPCRLMADWPVVASGWRFVVPAGAETDGASIPRSLWRVCGHPLEVPRCYAATAHDWLYGGGLPEMPRKDADRVYRALLIHFGVPRWKAFLEYAALRACGWSHWHEHETSQEDE